MLPDPALLELLSDIENERIDKTKWIHDSEVVPHIRLQNGIIKYTTNKGGLQYKGFSNLLDFYFNRKPPAVHAL